MDLMRREEKEIHQRDQIDAIIRESVICRIAMAMDDSPYLIPMSFGYDGKFLYLHSAKTGKKIDHFQANNRVCFEFERNVQLLQNPTNACSWSFTFETVIGHGRIDELIEPQQKAYGLNQIMAHYSDKGWTFDTEQLARVRVWRVSIDTLTGKGSHGSSDPG